MARQCNEQEGAQRTPAAMRTWSDITAPFPEMGIYEQRNDYQRQVKPRWKHANYIYVFPNQQGGLLPDGRFVPPIIPNTVNMPGFLMQNVRISNPQPVLLNSANGNPSTGVATMNAALGSANAAVPPQSQANWFSGAASNWGPD